MTVPRTPKYHRPVLAVPRSQVETALEILTLTGLLAILVMVGQAMPHLPARIPSHFDAAGHINGWADKTSLWLPVGMAGFTYVVLTLLRRYPNVYNYPVRITAQNAERQYALACSLLAWMKFWLMAVMGYLSYAMIQAASGNQAPLDPKYLFAGVAAVILTIVVYLVKAIRAR